MTLDITLSLARAGHLEKPDVASRKCALMSRAPEHVMHAMKPEFDGTDLSDNLEPNGSGCSSRFRPFVASSLLADVAPRRDDHDKRGSTILWATTSHFLARPGSRPEPSTP
jgi:hypothetical protein